jgi:hypothetical protein
MTPLGNQPLGGGEQACASLTLPSSDATNATPDTTATVLQDQIAIGKGDREPTGMLWRGQRGLIADRIGREAFKANSATKDFR